MELKTTNEGVYSSPKIKEIQVLSQSIICASPDDPTATGNDGEPEDL